MDAPGSRRGGNIRGGARRTWIRGLVLVGLAVVAMVAGIRILLGDGSGARIRTVLSVAEEKGIELPEGWEEKFSWKGVADRLSSQGLERQATGEALIAAVRSWLKDSPVEPWRLSKPVARPLFSMDDVVKQLAKGDGAQLYPLEVATVLAWYLGTEEIPVRVGERLGVRDGTPVDPSGVIGRYVLVVGDSKTVVDPFAPGDEVAAKDVRVLEDTQVLGAWMGLHGARSFFGRGDVSSCVRWSDRSLKLDSRSATVRGLRGQCLMRVSGPDEGLREIDVALNLQRDAPRLRFMAEGVLLGVPPDLNRAVVFVDEALGLAPNYAELLAVRANLHLARGEIGQARPLIERAARLAPDALGVPLARAQLSIQSKDMASAIRFAKQSTEVQSHDWNRRMAAAAILRMAGDYDSMRKEARAILGMVPGAQKSRVEQMIKQFLGPTALDDTFGQGDSFAEGDSLQDAPSRGDSLHGDLLQGDSLGDLDFPSDDGLSLGSGNSNDDPSSRRGPSLLDDDLKLEGFGNSGGGPGSFRLSDPSAE